jgi:hypothetical protein
VSGCRDALWLPYQRDEGLIREAIQAALQQGPIKAIFGHADVVSTVGFASVKTNLVKTNQTMYSQMPYVE